MNSPYRIISKPTTIEKKFKFKMPENIKDRLSAAGLFLVINGMLTALFLCVLVGINHYGEKGQPVCPAWIDIAMGISLSVFSLGVMIFVCLLSLYLLRVILGKEKL